MNTDKTRKDHLLGHRCSCSAQHSQHQSRRHFLAGMGAVAAGALLLPRPASAYVWQDVFNHKRDGGTLTVISQRGAAYINETLIRRGSKVQSRAKCVLPAKSQMGILLPDFSLLEIQGPAEVNIEIGQKVSCLYQVVSGGCTFVIRDSSFMYHLLIGNGSTFGIRNGVLFYRTFSSENPLPLGTYSSNQTESAQNTETTDQSSAIEEQKSDQQTPATAEFPPPPESSEYLCVCHGSADCLYSDLSRVFQIVDSRYHSAYYSMPEEQGFVLSAAPPQTSHSDLSINNLIDMVSPPIYPKHWLRP